MEKYERAEAFLEILNTHGIDTIFINPGIDTTPVQTAILRYTESGKTTPKLVLCLDESVAMTAAHGNYMFTGRPQVVMVHAELGTLQIGGALHNAQWGRVPVLILGGLLHENQRMNWMQQPYDQGSIVRNSVKFEYKVSKSENIFEVFHKAFQIACSQPSGPVYIIHPLGYLGEKIEKQSVSTPVPDMEAALSKDNNEQLNTIAKALVESKRPLILSGFTGRYTQSVDKLVELAEALSAPVITGPNRMNFPTTHPLCAGIEKGPGRRPNPHISNADVVLVIDYDMPYVPGREVPGQDTKIISIGVDSHTQGRPLWGRGPDLFMKTDSRKAIPALTLSIKRQLTAAKRSLYVERYKQLDRAHEEMRAVYQALALKVAKQKPISPDWLCKCIADAISEDTILVNHTISHFESVAEQIHRTRPGTLLSCPGGSINWALGAALGVKLAAPDKTVVSLMTDGGFVWGCPVATLWAANAYQAPFLSVIFDNQAYGAIKSIVKNNSEGRLSNKMGLEAGVDIASPPDYATVARACGAYGMIVENPEDVLPAIKEGLEKVKSGRSAVLDIKITGE